MKKNSKVALVALFLACGASGGLLRSSVAWAEEGVRGPDLRVVAVVHDVSFTLAQQIIGSKTQGPVTMVTKAVSVVPPGPPQINGAIPPGPPNTELMVRLRAGDMSLAHAAGALTVVGLMRGLSLQQIAGTFAQLNWNVQILAQTGRVDATIDEAKASALAQLLIATIIAGDRPGGGCLAAIPFISQGAAALGFAATCFPNQPNN